MKPKETSNQVLHSILFTVAIVFAMIIFIADIHVPSSVAFGAVYCMVVLYSWLLPGKYTVGIVGVICSILLIVGLMKSPQPEVNDQGTLVGINAIISLIVLWVCVALVAAARRGYSGLEMVLEELEDKVVERTKALEVKNKELEQFTYIASHDLQEPLRTVTSFTEFLQTNYDDQLDDQGKKSLQFMQDATQRMRNLIKGLLDYSRIGKDTGMQTVNCEQLLNEIKEDLAIVIKSHNAIITIENLPKNMKAYGLELRQLFQNLLTNALKFKKEDVVPEIHISSIQKNDYSDFMIRDNGIGIAKEHQNKIFKIFQRLHNASQYKGTGIGLAHCQKIVELHNGKIWVQSELGKGSTFYFRIPTNNI